jgi:hypothetical protein
MGKDSKSRPEHVSGRPTTQLTKALAWCLCGRKSPAGEICYETYSRTSKVSPRARKWEETNILVIGANRLHVIFFSDITKPLQLKP